MQVLSWFKSVIVAERNPASPVLFIKKNRTTVFEDF